MRFPFLSVVAIALTATTTAAQPAADTSQAAQFARARRLVSDGYGTLGRALVDTVLGAATPGTPAYAEALYWHATLAEHASDAERDYRKIAVEYPQTARAADALIRLAQYDLARGDQATAREHLTRLLRDQSDRTTQARAHYWLARAALDANDTGAACRALNDAASVSEPGSDVASQVVALRARVPRCTLHVAVGGAAPTAIAVDRATVPRPVPNATVPNATVRNGVPNAAAGRFTVQIAAFDTRAGAAATAARLVQRGLEARVEAGGPTPDAPPFRVRIGHYATRAEAATAQRELKTKGLNGFVAESGPPPVP